MTSRAYLLLTLLFYAVGALHVLAHVLVRRRALSSWTLSATLVGFAVHTAGLSQRWTEAGRFPAVGLHDGVSLLAWAIVLVFLLTFLRARVDALGLAVYPVAFALLLVANLTPASERADPILMSLYLPVHATLAFFGYAALFVACAMGGLYLIQERELKGRSPRAFYYLAPSLERCDTISGRAVAVGFVFLTLAIVTGVLWNEQARGRPFSGDAKEWSALIAWVIYVMLIVARRRTGWGGRRAALLGLVGFASVVFTFVWMTLGSGGGRPVAVIVVVGLSHRSAPLEVRETLAVHREKVGEAALRIREEAGLAEAMLLSTCNRVEVYGRADEPKAAAVADALCRAHARELRELEAHLYQLEGEEAVRHAFRVAASLDSMVIGEPQILGQVKEAYERAEAAGALGSVLSALRNRSLAAAKRARTETGIGRNAVSISSVAVELARKIFGELRARNVLLVGAGKMSELAARHLVDGGARATVLGGRTFERAAELAAALGGSAMPFESLRDELRRAEIVISGTGAPGLVIHRADVESALSSRGGRPLFFIDIAVPRDVDPEVGQLSGVFLYDLDDLKSVADANLRERRKEAAAAEALVAEEVSEFLSWRRSLDAVPLLVELRRRGDEIRKAELEKARRRLGPLSAQQEEALDAATTAIVNKLLHPPTVVLKELAKDGDAKAEVGLIRRLLGL